MCIYVYMSCKQLCKKHTSVYENKKFTLFADCILMYLTLFLNIHLMLFGLTENGFTSLTSFGKDSKKEVGSVVEVQ
jgi:hypothetical protein